jgi:hypothetical protein
MGSPHRRDRTGFAHGEQTMTIHNDKVPGTSRACYRVENMPVAGADKNAPWYFLPRAKRGKGGDGTYAWIWVNDALFEVIVEEGQLQSFPGGFFWTGPLLKMLSAARQAVVDLLADPTSDLRERIAFEIAVSANVAEVRLAVASGGYVEDEDDVRGFFEGGWGAFAADCDGRGVDPEKVVDRVVAVIVG